MKAFYFSTPERKLRFDDNRPIIVGETHSVEGPPKCGAKGLHASVRLIDALSYALGSILYLVELSGDIECSEDKVAATRRTYIAEFDATELLREFARKQALINIRLIEPYCSPEDYALIVEFLETGAEPLRAVTAAAAAAAATTAATTAAIAATATANEMLTSMVRSQTGWDI